MKISPIIYQSYTPRYSENKQQPNIYFGAGLKKPQITKTNSFLDKLKWGAAAIGSILSLSGLLSKGKNIDNTSQSSSKNVHQLFTELSRHTNGLILPDVFYTLHEKDPLLAEAIATSNRKCSHNLITAAINIEREEQLSPEEAEAIKLLIDLKDGRGQNMFSWMGIIGAAETLSEEEALGFVKNKSIFTDFCKKIPTDIAYTSAEEEDMLFVARALANCKDASAEELANFVYFIEDLSAEEKLLKWFKGEFKYRQQIFTILSSDQDIESIFKSYPYAFTPDQEFVNKLEFIQASKKELSAALCPPKKKHMFAPNTAFLMNPNLTIKDISKGLELFHSLPKRVRNHIRGTKLANEFLCFYSNVRNDEKLSIKNVKDYIKFAQIMTDANETHLLKTNALLKKFLITEEKNKKLLESNLKVLNEIRQDYGIKNEYLLTDLLFSDIFEKNYKIADRIINEDAQAILSALKIRCQDTNPGFLETAKAFLRNSEYNLAHLINTPNISKEVVINTLAQISKIIVAIAKEPKKYLAEDFNYRDLSIPDLKEFFKLYLLSPANAEKQLYYGKVNNARFVRLAKDHLLFGQQDITHLFNGISCTDAEYISILLDKGTHSAKENLATLEKFPYDIKEITGSLLKNGRIKNKNGQFIKLSGLQKTLLVNYLPLLSQIDSKELLKLFKKNQYAELKKGLFAFDFDNFIKDCNKIVLRELGYNDEKTLEELTNIWDPKFLYLINSSLYKNDNDMKLIFKLLSEYKVSEYIHDIKNPHGESNKRTQEIFETNGLNYKKWLTGIAPQEIQIDNEIYTIELLDRNTPNNLFMNNYTNCCTGIGRDFGSSMPTYILNTCFNILGIKNSEGEIVATSRIFMASTETRPILIIDNIEVCSNLRRIFQKNEEKAFDFVTQVWDYAKLFTRSFSKIDVPLYMTENNTKINLPPRREINKKIKLLGEVTNSTVYLNHEGFATNPETTYNNKFYKID